MALDEVRQALLDVFCHCYGLLLRHLDYLDGAVGAHHGWNKAVQDADDLSKARGKSPEHPS